MGNWLEGAFAPFCSARCRLIDLGKWLNEEHAVPHPQLVATADELGEDRKDSPASRDEE